jgi:hypothetical protein
LAALQRSQIWRKNAEAATSFHPFRTSLKITLANRRLFRQTALAP